MKVIWKDNEKLEFQMGANLVGVQRAGQRPNLIQLNNKDLRLLAIKIHMNPKSAEAYVNRLSLALGYPE